VVGEPPLFWRFNTAVLPDPHLIEQDGSDGDDCHHLIKGIDDDALWKVFETVSIEDLSFCTNGQYRSATLADILAHKTN